MGNKVNEIKALLILFSALLFAGCTENNGDIGNWFGMWQVTEIKINGIMDEDYVGNTVLKFQNDVMENMTQYDHHDTMNCFVKWRESGDRLIFEIPETTDETALYGYVPELLLSWLPIIEMKVVNLTGKTAELSYTGESGVTITYYLKKIY